MKHHIFAVVIVMLFASISWAESHSARAPENWPAWRGPLANGMAPHADPPVEWSASKNIKWKLNLPGQSNATPIIWMNRVFVVAAVESERTVDRLSTPTMEPPGGYRTKRPMNYYRFQIYCVDRNTGRILWQRVAAEKVPHEGRHGTNTYASGSPTTDGQRLYVTFGSHGLFCYDLDGNLLWQRNLGDMITRFGWGEGTSPTVYGDALTINWDHEGSSSVYVLDAKTGQTRWTAQRDEETSWSTPLIVKYKGTRQLIVNATRRVTSYDLDSSKILWECGGQTAVLVPSPVLLDDMVICMSGYRRAAVYAIGLDSTGDITDTDRIRWKYTRNAPYVPSPLLYGERLYFTQGNRASLTCLNARTGEPLFENVRLPELSQLYASPLGAANRIYFVGRNGTTVVIKNKPELEVLAVNRLDDPMDASPVAVGEDLFLRSKTRLYCITRTDR
jgi:outer membrane protein assembly factor BamB